MLKPVGDELIKNARVNHSAVHILRTWERPALNKDDALAGFGSSDGGTRTSWSGANNNDVGIGHDAPTCV